mgnify:FL=1
MGEAPADLSAMISAVETPMAASMMLGGAETVVNLSVLNGANPAPPVGWGPIHGLSDTLIGDAYARRASAPWAAAYDKMMTAGVAVAVSGVRPDTDFATSAPFTPAPTPILEDIVTGAGGKNNESWQLQPFKDDAIAAYTQALLWHMTGITQHKTNATNIVNAWAGTLTTVEGRNQNTPSGVGGIEAAKLACAWAAPMWARALDLLRRAGVNVSGMLGVLRTVVYPQIDWTGAGNPIMSMADARLNLAAVLRDEMLFDAAVDYLNYRIAGSFTLASDTLAMRQPVDYYYPTLPETGGLFIAGQGVSTADQVAQWWYFTNDASSNYVDGLGKENGRDISHTIMGLAAISNAFSTAQACGVDLFVTHQARMVATLELQAAWIREALWKQQVQGWSEATMNAAGWKPVGRYGPTGAADNTGQGWVVNPAWNWGGTGYRTGWEVFYAHYAERLSTPLPNVKLLLNGWTDGVETITGLRSLVARATNHTAYDQFTHAANV